MKFTLSQKILAGFIACAIILALVAVVSFRNSDKFIETSKWVSHTHEVLHEFDQILTASTDIESGTRGFVITGEKEFLDTYYNGLKDLDTHLEKVNRLTLDNALQQKNITELRLVIDELKGFRKELVETVQKDREKGFKLVMGGRGKYLQDEVRRIVSRSQEIENSLLTERSKTSEQDANNFNLLFFLLLVVITVVLISVYFIIHINLRALRKAQAESADKNWLLTGNFLLNEQSRGEQEPKRLSQSIIEHLCSYLKAEIGVIYLSENGLLVPAGAYAFNVKDLKSRVIAPGEGLVGQAAMSKKATVIMQVPDDYIKVQSGIGNASPRNLVYLPLFQDDNLRGVIEIGSLRNFSDLDVEFLDMVSENMAIAINAAQSRNKLQELLEETQRQSEELEAQQEELKQFNEELTEKTILLENSEAELKAQQEELQQSNEELMEKASLLEDQKGKLENAKLDIEVKARELEITSKYKSEFLANMSHELRTPLNSILILAQLLAENKNRSLGDKEVEFSKNIYNSGTDLLKLIDEILDLSKIEAGRMDLDLAPSTAGEINADMKAMFSELARTKSIDFKMKYDGVDDNTPLITDKHRLAQILRNLLSNAFKFTPKTGSVVLTTSKVDSSKLSFANKKLYEAAAVIAFSVKDTGIGIPKDKWSVVFEAFQQADGSTKRKYGGTGLGLSISRELANALGGEIQLESEEGKGSTFTLYLPSETDLAAPAEKPAVQRRQKEETATKRIPVKYEVENGEVDDDRNSIHEQNKVVLIIEDDVHFARHLLGFVRERGYKGVIALKGNIGLSYARHYRPDAILLDMNLPVMNGTDVLKQLKSDPSLRHIPVQIISAVDDRKQGMELGAFDFIRKPLSKDDLNNAFKRIEDFASRKLKRLLIIEDDETQNNAIRELIGNGDVKCFSAFSGKEGLATMQKEHYDCVIIDLGLPDMSGFELLEKIKADTQLRKTPVVVYTGRDLSRDEHKHLNRLASAVILKTADSQERLLDETILFLHRVESKLPKEKQNIIRKLHRTDEILKGKKVLVVDDDIRNIYSLTNALEEEGVNYITAENGRIALEILEDNKDVDIILMDVMMPEMDGYETTMALRASRAFARIPIIALTAKAMKGDREKCLAAGMSDYVSKPVNIEQLLSLMRVWLYN